MNKKILIVITIIIVVAGAVFLITRKEAPVITQAKEEVKRADEIYLNYQNTINAIPVLELSQDVKNDFKMEAAYFGILGYLEPGKEGLSPTAMLYANRLVAASQARSSPKLSLNLEDFDKFMENAVDISSVTNEDLGFLEKLADTFDEGVKQAKMNVPELNPLTVEKNKKTERYFLEFERIDQRLKALVSSLDNYLSSDFRSRIKKLKSANTIFGETAQFNLSLVKGKAWGYPLDISKTFPEVKNEESVVKNCTQFNSPATCKPTGPFPGGYQLLLQKLEPLYSQLIED